MSLLATYYIEISRNFSHGSLMVNFGDQGNELTLGKLGGSFQLIQLKVNATISEFS